MLLNCSYCGKKFKRKKVHKESKNYFCCKHCRDNFLRENTSDELSPFRYFIQKIESKSKKYNEISDIDLNFLKSLWHEQNGKCAYTGLDMKLPKTSHETVNSPMRASLDRIDSSRGYFKDNVEFVCQFVNLGKNTFSKKEIKKFLYRIKLNWREKDIDKNKK